MRTLLSLLSAAAIVAMIGTAQAQNAGAVVPQVIAPETTRSTVQGTSDAATKATQGTPAETKADKKDDKKDKAEKPKASEPKK